MKRFERPKARLLQPVRDRTGRTINPAIDDPHIFRRNDPKAAAAANHTSPADSPAGDLTTAGEILGPEQKVPTSRLIYGLSDAADQPALRIQYCLFALRKQGFGSGDIPQLPTRDVGMQNPPAICVPGMSCHDGLTFPAVSWDQPYTVSARSPAAPAVLVRSDLGQADRP